MKTHTLAAGPSFQQKNIYISSYYINTNEIPSELSRENLISSHVKMTCYLHTWKYHRCYGFIINRTIQTKNYLSKMVWFFIGVYIINRTLHGHLEIWNFSSRVEKNISLVREYFSKLKEKFRISARPCNILYISNWNKQTIKQCLKINTESKATNTSIELKETWVHTHSKAGCILKSLLWPSPSFSIAIAWGLASASWSCRHSALTCSGPLRNSASV